MSKPLLSCPVQAWAFATPCESVQRAHEAGIPLVAGTDCANPKTAHGASLHRELELMVHCGLTPATALQAVTANAAHHFNLQDRGTIATGKLYGPGQWRSYDRDLGDARH